MKAGEGITLGESLRPRSNSLNLIRLLLAASVVLSHAPLGGFGSELFLRWTTIGSLAVYCFFGISGYLIAGSAESNNFGRFLWHRVLRIFPAFWICLIVTAFVFGWLGWLHAGHGCGFACYLHEPGGPVDYVVHNAWLRSSQLTIPGTLKGIPFPLAWNGSIWTLFYEFLCYLLLGALALVGALRNRFLVAAIAVAVLVLECVVTSVPSLNMQFNAFNNWDLANLLRFVPVFLTGAAIYLYRKEIPDSGWLALCSLAATFAVYLVPVGNGIPGLTLTRADLSAFLLVYPTLWLGAHLPGRSIGVPNDYSYGLYIYAFPVAQLLAVWGACRWGYAPYVALTLVGAATLAFASWWLIEKRFLRLRDLGRSSSGGQIPLASVVPVQPTQVDSTPTTGLPT